MATVVAVAAAAAWSFPALATSDGVYDNERMGCTLLGYTYEKRNQDEPGCQGFTIHAGPAEEPDYVRVGFDQTPEGVGPHAGSVKVGAAGSSPTDDDRRLLVIAFDSGVAIVGPRTLTPEENQSPHLEFVSEPHLTWTVRPDNAPTVPEDSAAWSFYFYMDDNFTVFGEHHSISQANDPERDAPVAQGPVSGGGIRADTHPEGRDPTTNVDPSDRERPVRAAEFRAGFCNDGWCMSTQTQERTVYQGGGDGSRAAYDYEGLQPRDCQFRDPGPNCREYYDNEGHVYTPAGITIYQDPDPQAPTGFGPTADAMYPLAPTHVGAHGVLLFGVWILDLRDGSPTLVPGVLLFEPVESVERAASTSGARDRPPTNERIVGLGSVAVTTESAAAEPAVARVGEGLRGTIPELLTTRDLDGIQQP